MVNDVSNVYSEWVPEGDKAVELLEYEDRGEQYEVNEYILFKTEKGQYVVVHATGCSCWNPNPDEVEGTYTNELDAKAKFFSLLGDK